MDRKWPWVLLKVLAVLALVGLVIVGGFAIYRVAWSQGYHAAQLPVEGEVVPFGHAQLGHRGVYSAFGPGRCLIGAGVLLLLLMAFGAVMRLFAWKSMAAYGPWGAPHGSWNSHRFHGPMPPRWWAPWRGPDAWPAEAPPTEAAASGEEPPTAGEAGDQ